MITYQRCLFKLLLNQILLLQLLLLKTEGISEEA